MGDLEVEVAGFEIGGNPGNALSHLEKAVDGLDDSVGQACFEIGLNAREVSFEGSSPRAVGQPSQPMEADLRRSGPLVASRKAMARPRMDKHGLVCGADRGLLLRAPPFVARGHRPIAQIGPQ
jgi:hypothetical protein